jgi:hypothetical protein
LFDYELRQQSELYINQQAANAGYKTLVPLNLKQASDLTVANLYHYFKIREESEDKRGEQLTDNAQTILTQITPIKTENFPVELL